MLANARNACRREQGQWRKIVKYSVGRPSLSRRGTARVGRTHQDEGAWGQRVR